jgi:outer membrane protein OmpA-like peptidoglycan-associated protein
VFNEIIIRKKNIVLYVKMYKIAFILKSIEKYLNMKQNYMIKFIGFILILSALLSACKGGGGGDINEARKKFKTLEYAAAGDIYKKVYGKTKNKDIKKEAAFYAAECYRISNNWPVAEAWYTKAVQQDPTNAEAKYRQIQALKFSEKYVESITEANKYKKIVGSDPKIDLEDCGSVNSQKWKTEKTRYLVENVAKLNTKWSDFAPMYYRKDQLMFTSDRMEVGVSKKDKYGWFNNSYTDVYNTNLKLNKKNKEIIESYSLPVLVDKKSINGRFNDGTVCFDTKFTTMYFTKCNYGEKFDGKGAHCRIYESKLSGTEWSTPVALPFSTDSFDCGHPFLSKDGTTLFFSSNMPGSIAKPVTSAENPEGSQLSKDLYSVSYSKRGNAWGDPVNLGSTVNSEGDEGFPFQHEDGTLYYASNGKCGMGGLDVFYTKGQGKDWGDAINMKSPINSGGDDFALIVSKDKETGFFSSNRLNGGKGSDDIYRFTKTPLVFTLSGVARNSKTREVIKNATIAFTNSSDTVKLILKTDGVGSYKIPLRAGTDYDMYASKPLHYDSKIYSQTTKGLEVSTDLVQDLDLMPIDLETFTVKGIYYGLDSADIRPRSAEILDSLLIIMNKYPMLKFELGSHTDCRADSLYNMKLSQRRADSCVGYLISHGVDSNRLVSQGYGENDLFIKKCACEGVNEREQGQRCSEAEHQENRRTTVKVIDINYVAPAVRLKEKADAPKQLLPGQRVRPGTQPRR